MQPARSHRARGAIAVLGILLLAACDSGDGGSTPPTGPGPSILFTPDREAGANSVSMRSGAGSTASVLQLEIVATELLNVQAVSFVLLNPNDQMRFEGFEQGEFMGAAAQVAVGGGGNTLSFDILRIAPSAASGSGRIITLTFSALAAGSGRFDFIDPEAVDPFGIEIVGIAWVGGTVQVVR